MKINGERHYFWRAVDHEGEVLESFVTRTRDKKAALKFLKKTMRRHGRAESLVTDKLRSYGAALKELGAVERQETGQWANNRAENSHLPFRRRERATQRFRQMRSLQTLTSVHASVCNHFNQDRGLSKRDHFKANRAAALAEWRGPCANCGKTSARKPRRRRSRPPHPLYMQRLTNAKAPRFHGTRCVTPACMAMRSRFMTYHS